MIARLYHVSEGTGLQTSYATKLRAGFHQESVEAFYEGFREAGIDMAFFLPDSLLDGIEQYIIEKGEIEAYQCSREDEGIAMAMGSYLVGRRPVAFMESSGLGLSALVLARGIAQHTPTLIVAGHTFAFGERYDYHVASRMVGEPLLRALGIPCHVILDPSQIKTSVVQAQHTVEGQRIPVALLVPTHIIRAL